MYVCTGTYFLVEKDSVETKWKKDESSMVEEPERDVFEIDLNIIIILYVLL